MFHNNIDLSDDDPLNLKSLRAIYEGENSFCNIEDYEKALEEQLREHLKALVFSQEKCCAAECILNRDGDCYKVRRMLWALWELFFLRGDQRFISGELIKFRLQYVNYRMLWRLIWKYRHIQNSFHVLFDVERIKNGATKEKLEYRFLQSNGDSLGKTSFSSSFSLDFENWQALWNVFQGSNSTNSPVVDALKQALDAITLDSIPQFTNLVIKSRGDFARKTVSFCLELAGDWEWGWRENCTPPDLREATPLLNTFILKNFQYGLCLPFVPARIFPTLIMRRIIEKEHRETIAKPREEQKEVDKIVRVPDLPSTKTIDEPQRKGTLVLLIGHSDVLERIVPSKTRNEMTDGIRELEDNLDGMIREANRFWSRVRVQQDAKRSAQYVGRGGNLPILDVPITPQNPEDPVRSCTVDRTPLDIVPIGITDDVFIHSDNTEPKKEARTTLDAWITEIDSQITNIREKLQNAEEIILHIIGHGTFRKEGSAGGLLSFFNFEVDEPSPYNEELWVNAQKFTSKLMPMFKEEALKIPILVVLQVCHGSETDVSQNQGIVEAFLERDFPNVIGFHGLVDQTLSWRLFKRFYKLYFATLSTDFALLLHLAYQDELSTNQRPRDLLRTVGAFAVRQICHEQ